MRCLLCERWSLSHICKNCQEEHLAPSFYTRKIMGNIPVHSFYKYNEIENLLHTKHTDLGYYIYMILARNSMKKFADSFEYEGRVAALAIDDHSRNGYSHTALLVRELKSKIIRPCYGKIRAGNRESYSGKNYQYRLLHPRDFVLKPFKENDVILVDDILTTGLTLTQAAELLHTEGKRVLFCLALADADKK
ncbi:MAG: phosphoribosyltransferase [Helicobacteraceae bacterium 4484_230]|nr:MAG: phosphoribosyltransferase [Helicobacteraceae bacterium 4484_230]